MDPIFKKPSALAPILFSLVVIAMWFIRFTAVGVPVRQSDEGVAAHLFQIWLIVEVLLILYFAVEWLPKNPNQALLILAIQIILVFAGCAPVYYFKL